MLCGSRGGGTPLKIYDSQNDFMMTNNYDVNRNSKSWTFFKDNGNGTLTMYCSFTNFTWQVYLPNGYVFNGNQSFNFAENTQVSDGDSYMQLGKQFYNGNAILNINVRKQ